LTDCKDWYEKTQKVIFIEELSNYPVELKQIYISSLKRAAEYLGTAEKLNTEKFYLEWKNRLIENELLNINDYSVIDPMWCDYAEKRFYAGQFMLQLKTFLPKYEKELNELWDIFGKRINGLMYQYIDKVDLAPGADCQTINISKLNDETVRKEMCELIARCEEEERKAADIISKIASCI
jgi:hypothetical protein